MWTAHLHLRPAIPIFVCFFLAAKYPTLQARDLVRVPGALSCQHKSPTQLASANEENAVAGQMHRCKLNTTMWLHTCLSAYCSQLQLWVPSSLLFNPTVLSKHDTKQCSSTYAWTSSGERHCHVNMKAKLCVSITASRYHCTADHSLSWQHNLVFTFTVLVIPVQVCACFYARVSL